MLTAEFWILLTELAAAIALGVVIGVPAGLWLARRREQAAIDATAQRDAEMDEYYRSLPHRPWDDGDYLKNC